MEWVISIIGSIVFLLYFISFIVSIPIAYLSDFVHGHTIITFIIILTFVFSVVFLIYFFLIHKGKNEKSFDKHIAIVFLTNLSVCASCLILFAINNLIELTLSGGWFSGLLEFIFWPISIIPYILLFLGVPLVILVIYWFFSFDVETSKAKKVIFSFINCAVAVICTIIVLRPALIGDFSFYSGF